MSVIFGIKEYNCIIIAADKRGSNIDGRTISDNLDKIIVINEKLALSSAGNSAIDKAISLDISKISNKEDLTTSDILDIIKNFYKRVIEANCNSILALPYYFIIAGKGSDGNPSLISGGNIKGRIEAKEVPMVIYPPADTQMQACCDFFARNYKFDNKTFVEKTIKDISNISNLVSPSGDKWIYSFQTQKGSIFSF